MAIIKEVYYKWLPVNYWVIGVEYYDKQRDATIFRMSPYKDKSARVDSITYNIAELQQVITLPWRATTADWYTAFKSLEYFEWATDDI